KLKIGVWIQQFHFPCDADDGDYVPAGAPAGKKNFHSRWFKIFVRRTALKC
ncbi:MAG: hypothetical protein UY15_C0023G0017, partial [Parcubacteria group bacterium GW2011_GWA2_47_9]